MVLPHGQNSQVADSHSTGSWQDTSKAVDSDPSTTTIDGKRRVSSAQLDLRPPLRSTSARLYMLKKHNMVTNSILSLSV